MPGSCGTAVTRGLVVERPHGAYFRLTAAMLAVPPWAGLPGRTGVGLNVGLASLTFRPLTVTAQTVPPRAVLPCAVLPCAVLPWAVPTCAVLTCVEVVPPG